MARRILKRFLLVVAVLLLGAVIWVVATSYHPDIPAAELEAEYAGGASRFLEIEGSRVHYRDEGPPGAPAVLLLHGTASSLHTWDPWTRGLTDIYRVLRLDLPGYGLTGANTEGPGGRGDYSTDYRLRVIEGLMQELDAGRLAVAGNSLGGLLAWRYALARPERVDALILVDPAGAPRPETGDDAAFRAIDLARMPVLRHLMTRLTPRSLIRDALRQVYGDPSKVSDELVERHHRLLLREGNRQAMVEAAAERTLFAANPPLAEVSQPTLILWGAEDTWIPPGDGEVFDAEIPDSELIVYDGAGHVPMEEIPERTLADAREFLERRYAAGDAPIDAEVRHEAASGDSSAP